MECYCKFPDRGECYTFGSNQFGQLGVEGEISPRSVQKVTALEHIKIVKVACGDTFTTAISEGNVFSCCGKINHFLKLISCGIF